MASKSAVYLILICFLSVFIFSGSSHDPGLGPPFLDSLTPNSGSSFSNQPVTFTAVYGDPDGAAKIYSIGFQVSPTSGTSSSIIGIIYLGSSQGPHTVLVGSGAQSNICDNGNPQVLDFPSFQLDCSQLSVVMQGNLVTVNWPFVFKAPFAGTKNLYMSAKEKGPECAAQGGASTGWVDMGDWTVLNNAPDLNPLPEQTGAENSLITFALSAGDPDGDTLTYSMMNAPQDAELTPDTGIFSWTPDSGEQGSYTIDFSVTDGNLSDTEQIVVTVTDGTPPVTTADPPGGNFIGSADVTLAANEPATIYFTTDGSEPSTFSQVYSSPINLTETTTLKFFAVDTANNSEAVKTEVYTRTGGPTYVPGGQITEDTVWTLANSPYIVQGNVSVISIVPDTPVTLTIEPGVEVRFLAGTQLSIDNYFSQGILIAQGTSAQLIKFTSDQPTPNPGDWSGIIFNATGQSNSILEYAVVEYAAQAGITVMASQPTIRNVVIRQNSGSALLINAGAPFVELSSFLNNQGDAVQAFGPLETRNFEPSNTFSGNGRDIIRWTNTFISEISTNFTFRNLGVPYVLDGSIRLGVLFPPFPTVTVEPGVIFRFSSQNFHFFDIGSGGVTFLAQGTSSSPIVFTSDQASPSPGDWEGLIISPSTLAGSTLSHSVIEYGGAGQFGGSANVTVNNAPLEIQNSAIRFSAGDGISATGAHQLILRNNVFEGNNGNAVNNTAFSYIVQAQLNWWGDASGPSGTGLGTGVPIAGDIDFDPWLSTPVTAPSQWSNAHVSPRMFKPIDNSATFFFKATDPVSWTIEILDSTMTQMHKAIMGNGPQIDQNWAGDDETATALPDGEYRFRVSGTNTSTSQVLAPAVGVINIDGNIPIAKITQPLINQVLSGVSTAAVIGTAMDDDFRDYKLEWFNTFFGTPPGFPATEIIFSTSPVNNSLLSNWDLANLLDANVTLRLTVTDNLDRTATDEVPINVFNVSNIASSENYISPNGDGMKDNALITAVSTLAANWLLELKDQGNQAIRSANVTNKRNFDFTWDGLDNLSAPVPDGVYIYELTLTEPASGISLPIQQGGTTITVDTLAPTALIDDPTPDQTIVGFVYDVIGTADDVNFDRYITSRGSPLNPTAFEDFEIFQTPVTNGVLKSLVDLDLLNPDDYLFQLEVFDKADNKSVVVVPFTLDNLTINDVSRSVAVLDHKRGDTTSIFYSVDADSDITIKIYDELTHSVVRTLINDEFQTAGPHSVIWDGRNDATQFVPYEAYYFDITAIAADGRGDRFIDFYTGITFEFPVTTQNVNFDPFRNESLSIQYNVTEFRRQPISIRDSSSTALIRSLVANEPKIPGLRVESWDGRDDNRSIFTGNYFILFEVPSSFPSQVIVLQNSIFLNPVSNFRAEAYLILPAHSEVSTIKYDLNVPAQISVAIKDPNGNHFRTLLSSQAQTPGQQILTWDGSNDNGEYASIEGSYTVEIVATDPDTGSIWEKQGSVTVYR